MTRRLHQWWCGLWRGHGPMVIDATPDFSADHGGGAGRMHCNRCGKRFDI